MKIMLRWCTVGVEMDVTERKNNQVAAVMDTAQHGATQVSQPWSSEAAPRTTGRWGEIYELRVIKWNRRLCDPLLKMSMHSNNGEDTV